MTGSYERFRGLAYNGIPNCVMKDGGRSRMSVT